MTNKNGDLANTYRRILHSKDGCCPGWFKDRKQFYEWYNQRFEQQDGRCEYCRLPGDTIKAGYGHYFRKGTRGKRLEVDRIKSKEPYSPDNCVLACYPCNNAKSDVFSYEDFLEIGKAIRKVKTGAVHVSPKCTQCKNHLVKIGKHRI